MPSTSYLDALLGPTVIATGGTPLATQRGVLNIVSGATAADNPTTGQTDLTITGGGGVTGQSVVNHGNSDYTITQSSGFLTVRLSGLTANRTVIMPNAVDSTQPVEGFRVTIVDADGSLATHNIILSKGGGSDTIAGGSSLTMSSAYPYGARAAVTLEYNAARTDWMVVA